MEEHDPFSVNNQDSRGRVHIGLEMDVLLNA